MTNYHRAARNQIATSLSENARLFGGGKDCKWSADLKKTARNIIRGGVISPYDVCHSHFSSEKIAKAAISMCVEHHPCSSHKVVELNDGKFYVDLWN